ncbi:conserved leucine-rich repeat protein [Neofusicoccum parvum]|uniref:Conserved leucine-rich repeat protein n=1 Tax=Neofusicoccum parvum TaxID=310453 RepID=A0ACB5RSC1_9PEZI|nr:conserved leucine-rich repeat protein [Neofusicoccum parvum]
MGLSEIPKQVLTMYEYDPDAGASWSEAVDLVRFNAADNEIERLEDELFPDIDPEEAAEDMDATGPQFGGLEMLDLHGNILKQLPIGLRRLERLTVLNMANFNGNDISKIDPEIGLMESLDMFTLAANPLRERKFLTMNTADLKRDLKMRHNPAAVVAEAENGGDLEDSANGIIPTNSMWTLKSSGVLDLSSKELTDLDEEQFTPLANDCRQLILHHNNISYIPDAVALAQNITLLDLSNNRLTTTFTDDASLPSLRELRLSANRLPSLEFLVSSLSAPRLGHLDVSSNRLSGPLPHLRRRFPELITLLASDNGFESITVEALDGLTTVALANNSIDRVPPQVGLLWEKGLRSLEIEGNTFRVPTYATLKRGTEAVMSWLRDKIPAAEMPARYEVEDEGDGLGDDETF